MRKNPYALVFGREPSQVIPRASTITEIVETFDEQALSQQVYQQVYLITGVRGSGKTVLMTEVSARLRQRDDWVVVELNPRARHASVACRESQQPPEPRQTLPVGKDQPCVFWLRP